MIENLNLEFEGKKASFSGKLIVTVLIIIAVLAIYERAFGEIENDKGREPKRAPESHRGLLLDI